MSYQFNCLPPYSPHVELQNYDFVFTGKVKKVARTGEFEDTATIDVERVFKGKKIGSVRVVTGSNGAICGVGFKADEQYLVYAKIWEGKWRAHLCSRTKTLEQAEKEGELEELRDAPQYPVSANKALEIAKERVEGTIDLSAGYQLKIGLTDGFYVVVYATLPSKEPMPMADYHAKLKIDATTGEVIEFLVGS